METDKTSGGAFLEYDPRISHAAPRENATLQRARNLTTFDNRRCEQSKASTKTHYELTAVVLIKNVKRTTKTVLTALNPRERFFSRTTSASLLGLLTQEVNKAVSMKQHVNARFIINSFV